MSRARALIDENIVLLDQATSIISILTDDIYRNDTNPYFLSGVGRHMRHILDFYQNLVSIEAQRIDYDIRTRSREVETNRSVALTKIDTIRSEILRLDPVDTTITVKNDDGGHRLAETEFSPSTIGRELQFLASHTVHHYALIAMILRLQDIQPPAEFGVAPSTLRHMKATQSGRQ